MASIFSVFGEIFLESSKAEKGIKDITQQGANADKSLSSKFTSIAGNAVKMGTAFVGAASVVGGAAVALVTKVADSASAIDDSSQRVGMSAENYQKYAFAAKQSGLEISTLETLMKKQQTVFADATNGNKTAAKAYKDLGIDIKGLTAGDAFDKAIEALAGMDDVTQRNAIANDLFGKSYADLSPLLNEGKDGIQALKDEAVKMGAVMSNDSVKAGAKLGDSIDKIKDGFAGMVNNLVGSVLPVVQELMDIVIANMPMISNMIQSLAPVLSMVFTSLLPPLIELIQNILPVVIELINLLVPIIAQVLNAIMPIVIVIVQQMLPPIIQLITTVLPVAMSIIRTVASVLTAVLVPAIKMVGGIANGLTTIFKNVFGGLWEFIKQPLNFIIDKINGFITWLNKLKIPDWVPGIGGKGLNFTKIAKFQIGMDYIPSDNYPALLHKGERVLTSEENKDYKKENRMNGQSPEENARIMRMALNGMVFNFREDGLLELVDNYIAKVVTT